jgi:hypothetical protein
MYVYVCMCVCVYVCVCVDEIIYTNKKEIKHIVSPSSRHSVDVYPSRRRMHDTSVARFASATRTNQHTIKL